MRFFIFFQIINFFVASILAHAETPSVGITRIETELASTEIPVRIFYPTTKPAEETSFGPWVIQAARNAPLADGTYPMIIISHGLNGTDWNHHLLASKLVAEGFVVAAVRHADDLLRVGNPEHMVLRPLELNAAINAVLQDTRFENRIDVNRIGAFGFSLGGFTVLASAGGVSDHSRIAEHCKTPEHDPEYCIGEDGGASFTLWLRARRAVYSLPEIDIDQDVLDTRIKAIVIAAPVGQPFNNLSRVTVPVMLIRAGSDMSLRYPFHAENIHKLLPKDHVYVEIEGLHHYAFLSPFPERIASEVGEPAIDPANFDRSKFLEGINSSIVSFFTEHLAQ